MSKNTNPNKGKIIPYVHSKYPRKENDDYPTMDARCTWAFLEVFQPSGLCVDVCAPTGSGITAVLNGEGYVASNVGDAFEEKVLCDWIVTNTPYLKGMVDKIIYRQIERLQKREVNHLACLLKATFPFAKGRRKMLEDNPLFQGQIMLRFRPWWSEERTASPIHNYIWLIWSKTPRVGEPKIWWANGAEPKTQS